MFPLHQTTRRRICRSGFVLLCAVPLALVLLWATWLARPEHRDGVARELGQRLGMSVKLSAVRHPRPMVTLLEGLELSDPETGAHLARLRMVEIDSSGGILLIAGYQPEIELGDGAAWRDLLAREMRRPYDGSGGVRLNCGELTLHMPGGAQTLTDVRCELEIKETGSEATCSFQSASTPGAEPATLRVVRNRQTSPPTSGFDLETGAATLPCGLLAAAWPPAGGLGPQCRFRGSFSATEDTQGWTGQLVGRLLDIELNELVGGRFAHKLSGRGDLAIERLRFHSGRIEQAAGVLTAGPGLVSRSLIKAAGDCLGLVPDGEIKTLGSSVPYEQLATAFALDEHGLAVRGQCGDPAPGAMLRDRTGALLLEPQKASQPVVNLVRMLVPDQPLQVPLAPEIEHLAHVLPVPLPQVSPSSDGSPPLPQARRLRLHKTSE